MLPGKLDYSAISAIANETGHGTSYHALSTITRVLATSALANYLPDTLWLNQTEQTHEDVSRAIFEINNVVTQDTDMIYPVMFFAPQFDSDIGSPVFSKTDTGLFNNRWQLEEGDGISMSVWGLPEGDYWMRIWGRCAGSPPEYVMVHYGTTGSSILAIHTGIFPPSTDFDVSGQWTNIWEPQPDGRLLRFRQYGDPGRAFIYACAIYPQSP